MPADQSIPVTYDERTEVVPADEADDTVRVIAALQQILRHSLSQTGQYHGDVHVKSAGCATGEFEVLPNLPDELAQGLFQRPESYAATVRFSNGAGQKNSDWMPDGRGLAIKVHGVRGERADARLPDLSTQDFLMVNHPVFVARNVKDYLRLEELLATTADRPVAMLVGALTGGNWNPLAWHWNEAIAVAQAVAKLPAHPAANLYFSMSPFRFGKYVAKYRAKPTDDRHDSFLKVVSKLSTEADALRLMLAETLRSEPVRFEFQVQLRTAVDSMPVEDPTVEWPESESPYRTVATLLLPKQEIDAQTQRDACSQLSFNVWDGLAVHRPLGGINRLRKAVYPVSANWRHQGQSLPT